jgi:predicted nucleic acid-binding Zn ribbon protein
MLFKPHHRRHSKCNVALPNDDRLASDYCIQIVLKIKVRIIRNQFQFVLITFPWDSCCLASAARIRLTSNL